MNDLIYLENGEIKVSEAAMQIPEFKELKRYDKSTNKVWFNTVISYLYFVYKIFGDKPSYLANTPLMQRKTITVKNHTGKYKDLSDFEDNERVQSVVSAYLKYSRTRSEILFDSLKDDVDAYSDYVQTIPKFHLKKVTVPVKVQGDEGVIDRLVEVEVEIPNTKERIDAIKGAKELDDLYKKLYKDALKDATNRDAGSKLFEDKSSIAELNYNEEDITVSE